VPNCKLSTDADLAKKNAVRGYSEEFVISAFGVDIFSVLWRDTKTVRLSSSYMGTQPFLSRDMDSQLQSIKLPDGIGVATFKTNLQYMVLLIALADIIAAKTLNFKTASSKNVNSLYYIKCYYFKYNCREN